ncbi:MAG TPA: biotin--[acetyl-CoA-carboxylase] ligase [Candidatus Binataceae bacterium]|nr:biotin--[acetyl-CoA-carboxylase] ligase [Candidatus Binataceae bacterium]
MPDNPYRSIERGEPGRIGWRIHYFDEVDSTQEIARELAAQGSQQGTAIIADRQTAGRGRLGRSWHSPAGANLYTTIILRPAMPLASVPQLSLVAGLAVADVLERVAPGIVGLKWPNDVWLRGRKVSGMIAEAITDKRGNLECVLLGIGINVNLTASDIPDELRERATSIRIATGRAWDRIELADSLFSLLDSRYMEALTAGFAAVRPAWERYSALTGKRVAIVDGGRRQGGIVRGIDDDGALMLDLGDKVERIVAGEVTVEGAYA